MPNLIAAVALVVRDYDEAIHSSPRSCGSRSRTPHFRAANAG